jgi:hypothetical protein
MRFARIVFTVAGLWGLAVLLPMYFTFDLIGRLYPPAITHPDLYYGFVGVAVAWQVAFLVIGRDPARFRMMMIPAMLEKFIWVATLSVTYLQGGIQRGQFAVAGPDFVLGVLFVMSFKASGRPQRRRDTETEATRRPASQAGSTGGPVVDSTTRAITEGR